MCFGSAHSAEAFGSAEVNVHSHQAHRQTFGWDIEETKTFWSQPPHQEIGSLLILFE